VHREQGSWKAVSAAAPGYRLLWTGLAVALLGSGLGWSRWLAVIELGGGPVQLSVVTTAYSIGCWSACCSADRGRRLSTLGDHRGRHVRVPSCWWWGPRFAGLLGVWHIAGRRVIIGAGRRLIPAYTR